MMNARLRNGLIAALVVVTASAFIIAGVIAARPPVTTVVAIGDSIMAGHGLRPDQAWVAILAKERGWKLTNLASDGSGFLKVGTRGDTFADQAKVAVKLHPSIVILAGSSNDLGESDSVLAEQTTRTIVSIRTALPTARIIAISAVWGAAEEPAQLKDIDRQLDSADAKYRVEFFNIGEPLAGHPELMQADGVHPTAAGQVVLAQAVSAAIRAKHGRL